MNEKETITNLMDQLVNIRRIQNSEDMKKEVDYQIKILKAKLEACGVNTEEL